MVLQLYLFKGGFTIKKSDELFKLFRGYQARLFKPRLIGSGLAAAFLLMLSTEITLNLMIRASLRRSLLDKPTNASRLETRLPWLSLGDLKKGRCGPFRIKGENCRINGLRFQNFSMISRGFTFAPSRLLTERKLELRTMNQTRLTAVIAAASLEAYLGIKYPKLHPEIRIIPGIIIVNGQAALFGKKIPVTLAGTLRRSAPQTIRFEPERLQVSGKELPRKLLRFAGKQLPLEFALLENWPLRIEHLSLNNNSLTVGFRDFQS